MSLCAGHEVEELGRSPETVATVAWAVKEDPIHATMDAIHEAYRAVPDEAAPGFLSIGPPKVRLDE